MGLKSKARAGDKSLRRGLRSALWSRCFKNGVLRFGVEIQEERQLIT